MSLLDSLPKERLTQNEEFALAAQIQKTPTDQDLLNTLVLHNMEEGFRYTKGVCRSKIADDELFSLVYQTLYRNAKRFQPGGIRFHAFAKAGLRGAVSRYWRTLNTVRNATEMITLSVPRDEEEGESNFEPHVDAEFSAIHFRERFEFVKAAMKKKLSPQERMIIDLVYNQSFNFQEIGDLLGITRSAIQSTHAECLKKIRQELDRKRLLSE